jgi:cytochrome bd-type quinol oxidase subunit 1
MVLSLAFYVVIYTAVYAAAGYYLVRLVRHGPADAAAPDPVLSFETESRHSH